jgi:predicted nucleic acid-binding Zn ribbon protein
MATYEYVCHDCCILMPKEYDFAKNPSKIKCPECGKMCEQNWAGRDIPVHFKGAGWTGKNSQTGFNKVGGSDEINLKLQEETKDRIAGGWKQYAKYTPPKKLLDKAKKLNDQEVANKLNASKKLSDETYHKAGINPHNKYKGQ